jgi:hypothetical protein
MSGKRDRVMNRTSWGERCELSYSEFLRREFVDLKLDNSCLTGGQKNHKPVD